MNRLTSSFHALYLLLLCPFHKYWSLSLIFYADIILYLDMLCFVYNIIMEWKMVLCAQVFMAQHPTNVLFLVIHEE